MNGGGGGEGRMEGENDPRTAQTMSDGFNTEPLSEKSRADKSMAIVVQICLKTEIYRVACQQQSESTRRLTMKHITIQLLGQ